MYPLAGSLALVLTFRTLARRRRCNTNKDKKKCVRKYTDKDAERGFRKFAPSGVNGFVVAVTRMMLPDDANPGGNVHGGTIMKMIERASYVIARRYCGPDMVTYAVPHVSFHKPMFIGSLCRIEGKLVYVEDRYAEVMVRVFREENDGGLTLTNTASVYFCKLKSPTKDAINLPPPLATTDEAVTRCANVRASRRHQKQTTTQSFPTTPLIAQLMLPSDAARSGLVFGGTLMKMMDNAAGVVSYRYCRTNVVTVSMDELFFLEPSRVGDLVSVSGQPVFTSQRSLEMRLWAFKDSAEGAVLCATGRFTFVSLNKERRTQPMPPFVPRTEQERVLEAEARERYMLAKAARAKRKS